MNNLFHAVTVAALAVQHETARVDMARAAEAHAAARRWQRESDMRSASAANLAAYWRMVRAERAFMDLPIGVRS